MKDKPCCLLPSKVLTKPFWEVCCFSSCYTLLGELIDLSVKISNSVDALSYLLSVSVLSILSFSIICEWVCKLSESSTTYCSTSCCEDLKRSGLFYQRFSLSWHWLRTSSWLICTRTFVVAFSSYCWPTTTTRHVSK